VNIGEIGSDSGLLGTIVGYMRQGAEIWAAYINQHGGLGCHKVNLITADDGGDPSTALSEAQTMVQQDHVLALVSMADPLSLPTIAPYLQQAGVPVVGGVLVESQWYTNPDLFPQGSAFRVTVDGSVKAGIDQGATKVGVIACVELALICSNAANDLQQDTAAMGGQFVYSASVSLAQPDFTSQCLGAKAAGVTNLFLSLEPNSDIRLIGDCANQNYHPTFSTLGFALIPELINTPNANGMVTASGVFPFSAVSPATAQFDQAVQQATGGPPNSGLFAAAWVAGLVLQTAANELPATNPTPADILAGLYRIKNDNFGGLTSPITYTKGQPAVSPTCYWPIDVKSGAAVAPLGLQSQCLPSGVG
jgi:branched-chain amino acid transport system substrate-binding protein